MSFDDGFILGLSLGSGGGSGDDDKPAYLNDPDYALYQELPEPAENQFVGLIRMADDNSTIYPLSVSWNSGTETDVTYGTIDYGDGTTEKVTTDSITHTYSKKGDYTIIFTDLSSGLIANVGFNISNKSYIIAVKVGTDKYTESIGSRIINFPKYLQIDSECFFTKGYSFSDTSLCKIDFLGDYKPTVINDNTFHSCNSLDFSNLQDIFSEVTEAGNGSFSTCHQMKKISLPKCTKLGTGSFSDCYSLEEIDLSSYEIIPNSCFLNCRSLKSVKLSICTEIGERAFQYCYSLKNANAPKCTKIGFSAFFQDTTLTEIKAPQCLEVGGQGFALCNSLLVAEFAENCTFGTNAFSSKCLIPAPNGTYPS